LSARHEIEDQPGANEIRAESATPGCDSAIAPTILDNQRALTQTNDADIASERTSLPESAALMLSDFNQGFRPEIKEKQANAVGTLVPETVFRNDDPVHIFVGLQQPVETVSNRRAATSTGSRLLWRVVVLIALLAAMAWSVYYYRWHSAQLPESQGVDQLAPPLAGGATIVLPLPVSDTEMKPHQDQQIIKDCPQAVAVLGLCIPDTKQE
jgi:hypothetical protein